MEYRLFGNSQKKVSRLGYGGTTEGLKNYIQSFDPETQNTKEQIIEALQTAYKLGINYFDTAAGYGDGTSEKIYGEALFGIPAEDIFLATKASPSDARSARLSLERSLVNLRRDYIDLIQIHGSFYPEETCDFILAKGGMMDALEQARGEGLVKYIGFTIECQNPSLYRFIESGRFDSMQVEYNLIFQHPYDPSWKCGSIYEAKKQNMAVIAMRTLTSGTFQKWIKTVNPENTFDYTPALLQFVLSNPFVDVALAGMRSAFEVTANVNTCDDFASRINLDELHTRYV
jgi:predicted aldo/keto reductase-like oxidoreductase